MRRSVVFVCSVLFFPSGCVGTGVAAEGDFDPGDWQPPPDALACPMDPDAFIGGDPDRYECPDYWTCEDLADGVKRCTNPGPDYPDGGEWDCRDEGGSTICEGSDFPDGGGGDGWSCEARGDLVICEDDRPDYPDDGGGGGWSCVFWDEFRICDDGGDEPDSPDDGDDFCFLPEDGSSSEVLVRGGFRFETHAGREAIHVGLVFSEAFVDNTYGVNSSDGYHRDRGHRFRELVGSDHAEIGFEDASGVEIVRARFDYLSESDDAPSGYDSMGVHDGDGRMIEGDESVILDATSSLARNLNDRGCVFLEDSPTPAECPDWDRRVVYEVWLDRAAFADGFGGPALEEVHASPSRTDNTIVVRRGECP